MKNLRRKFDIYCFKNRNKGIPNLMLYVTLGSAAVYLFYMITESTWLYELLCFDCQLILQGQIWRLFTYAFTYDGGSILSTVIGLFCYYSLGKAMENVWGTFRFNLFYFSGIIMMDAFALIVGAFFADNEMMLYFLNYAVGIGSLNLSLFMAYATMYPESSFLLMFIIPVKAWIFALVYLGITIYQVIIYSVPTFLFPLNLLPLVSLANYFLFFGKDVLNVIPVSWRANARRLFKRKAKGQSGPKAVPFPNAGSYEASVARTKAPYTHKCTICGRTDVDAPDLEFRYCSRCKGYHCYCEDHISNHTHVE